MSEYLGLTSRTPEKDWSKHDTIERPPAREAAGSEVAPAAGLFPCSDCGHRVSRYAEACPNCGRYFQNFRPLDRLVIPGHGWVAKIAWGIVLSSILWAVIFGVLLFLFMVLIGGLAGLGSSVPRR